MHPQDPNGGAPGGWPSQGQTPPGYYGPPPGYPPPQGYPQPPGYPPQQGYPQPGWGMQQAPVKKSGVKPWVVVVAVFGWIVVMGAWLGIRESVDAPGSSERGIFDTSDEVVKSTDGRSQVKVPSSWRTLPDLNDEAVVEVGNEFAEQYLVVISEPRVDFASDVDLQRYADVCLGLMKENLRDVEVAPPREVVVNGRKALRYEIRGTVDFVNVVYLATFVEGQNSFHQVLAWTMKSRFDSAKPALEAAADSFVEIEPTK